MKLPTYALVAQLALALTACGSVRTYSYPLAAPQTPTNAAPPSIYFEGNLPAGNMQELALVEAVGYGTKANMEEVAAGLQSQAAHFGANAIVRVKIDCGYSQCHGWGVAVKLIDK